MNGRAKLEKLLQLLVEKNHFSRGEAEEYLEETLHSSGEERQERIKHLKILKDLPAKPEAPIGPATPTAPIAAAKTVPSLPVASTPINPDASPIKGLLDELVKKGKFNERHVARHISEFAELDEAEKPGRIAYLEKLLADDTPLGTPAPSIPQGQVGAQPPASPPLGGNTMGSSPGKALGGSSRNLPDEFLQTAMVGVNSGTYDTSQIGALQKRFSVAGPDEQESILRGMEIEIEKTRNPKGEPPTSAREAFGGTSTDKSKTGAGGSLIKGKLKQEPYVAAAAFKPVLEKLKQAGMLDEAADLSLATDLPTITDLLSKTNLPKNSWKRLENFGERDHVEVDELNRMVSAVDREADLAIRKTNRVGGGRSGVQVPKKDHKLLFQLSRMFGGDEKEVRKLIANPKVAEDLAEQAFMALETGKLPEGAPNILRQLKDAMAGPPQAPASKFATGISTETAGDRVRARKAGKREFDLRAEGPGVSREERLLRTQRLVDQENLTHTKAESARKIIEEGATPAGQAKELSLIQRARDSLKDSSGQPLTPESGRKATLGVVSKIKGMREAEAAAEVAAGKPLAKIAQFLGGPTGAKNPKSTLAGWGGASALLMMLQKFLGSNRQDAIMKASGQIGRSSDELLSDLYAQEAMQRRQAVMSEGQQDPMTVLSQLMSARNREQLLPSEQSI